jgi:putative ABC transport system permease protein
MKRVRTPLADRLYGWLLKAFPAEFRGDFGEAMAEDFRDQRQDAYASRGRAGVARLWCRTMVDLFRRAPREQADVIGADVRFALRIMRRHAVSTAVIIVLLAAGIGANVAVFQFADPMVRRPLPVPRGDELVRIVNIGEGPQVSYPTFLDLRTRSRAFADVAAHQYTTVSLGTAEDARAVGGEVVSGNYFDVLAIRPALGRLLQPSDDSSVGAHPVVVISSGLWREQFSGAPDVIGKTIYLNGYPQEIVGVAPDGFSGSYTAFASRFWAPIAMYRQIRPQNIDLNKRGWSWLTMTARLAPDVDITRAASDVARVAAELDREYPEGEKRQFGALRAAGLPEGMRQSAAQVLTFAAVIAALVLLVTCANVAGVLQSRAAARVRETSIRYALGASRLRIVRQSLTESVCLALVGGIAGLAVARAMQIGLARLLRTAVPLELAASPALDFRILVFAAAIAVAAGLVFGLFPAWRAAARGESTLREGSSTLAGSRSGARSIRALVAIQVAVCMCLLITGGLLARSLQNARTFDPGFDSSHVVVSRVDLRRHGYDHARGAVFLETVLRSLRARAEVAAASVALVVPLGGSQERLGFTIPGYITPTGKGIVAIDVNAIGADYFKTMSIPIVQGRGITDADDSRSRPVAVVNETMARRYWPAGNPVGQTFSLAGGAGTPLEIVGIVRDLKYYSLDETPRPYVYLSALQNGDAAPVLHVRVIGNPAPFVATLKREIAAVDPRVVAEQTMTFDELRQQPLVVRRVMAVVANTFSALALMLAIVGIYGTMSDAVGQRTKEIGVRMTFGARAADVYGLVLRDGLTPVALGIALGLAATGLVTRLIASELFGIAASDPLTRIVAAASVVIASIVALSFPAHRATRVDPVRILREP